MMTIRRYAAEYNFTMEMLRSWGSEVRATFVSDNNAISLPSDSAGIADNSGLKAEVSALREQCTVLTAEVGELKKLILQLQVKYYITNFLSCSYI